LYRLRTSALGNNNFQLNSTCVHKYEYQNSEGGEWHQNVGVYSGTGPVFRWQTNFALNWSRGDFGAGLAGHHKSGYVDQDPTNRIASYTTFDG
jgi:iron complex outermembrane receptor protein